MDVFFCLLGLGEKIEVVFNKRPVHSFRTLGLDTYRFD